jgi:hypothetical protein
MEFAYSRQNTLLFNTLRFIWVRLSCSHRLGVEFYDDLNAPVDMPDALRIQRLVVEQVNNVIYL